MLEVLSKQNIFNFDKVLREISKQFKNPAERKSYYNQLFTWKNNTDVYKTSTLVSIKDIDVYKLVNIIYHLAAMFRYICDMRYKLLTSKDVDKKEKLTFVSVLQENVRCLENCARDYAINNIEKGELFYNVHANKIHTKLRNDYNFIIFKVRMIKEIESYCKINKIKKYCKEFRHSVHDVKNSDISEIKIYKSINDAADNSNKLYSNRIEDINLCLKKAKTRDVVNVSENKNFINFTKNVIRTVFGIKCLFGAEFWQTKQIKTKTNEIKTIISTTELTELKL